MDVIETYFPNFDDNGKALVREAYKIAEKSLDGQTRGNGRPFLEHPLNVARIATDETRGHEIRRRD